MRRQSRGLDPNVHGALKVAEDGRGLRRKYEDVNFRCSLESGIVGRTCEASVFRGGVASRECADFAEQRAGFWRLGGNTSMDERDVAASGVGIAAPPDAPSDEMTTTQKRSAARRPRARRSHPRLRRFAARVAITLSGLLMIAIVTASLIESDWRSFNPVSGIGIVTQLPLQPQDFGQTARFSPPTSPVSSGHSAISIETDPPKAKPTATPIPVGPGSSLASTYTGSWNGGAGQGCPSGGAPKPASNIIYNAGSYGIGHTNEVALTFDDGPTPYSSPAILSFLEQSHTPATFFVLGMYARAYPGLIQREAADGFAIGVHTWDHPDMRLLSPSARANELGATVQQLHADLGPSVCIWLWRPPYGDVNSSIVTQAGGFGLTTIYWDVDPQDWARPGVMAIANRVLAQVRPGSIILMHDGPAARQETADALPYILAGLHSRGLVPVTLPTLLASESAPTGPAPAPTVTPTATPAAPTPTATASPTATATATATATSSPTATATASPTATTTGVVVGASVDLPRSLSLSLWNNIIPGYSGA